MIFLASFLLTLVSQPSFAEGGVGVKNGASGMICPGRNQHLQMLEVVEVKSLAFSHITEIQDRTAFFNRIFRILAFVGTDAAFRLRTSLMEVLDLHGPVTQWPFTPIRVPTILYEDDWSIKKLAAVDWKNATVTLWNGCQIRPISYLTPATVRTTVSLPRLVMENFNDLDLFNRNVLELHEAIYEVFNLRNHTLLTVLPTRFLIRSLLNDRAPIELITSQVERFMGPNWFSTPRLYIPTTSQKLPSPDRLRHPK